MHPVFVELCVFLSSWLSFSHFLLFIFEFCLTLPFKSLIIIYFCPQVSYIGKKMSSRNHIKPKFQVGDTVRVASREEMLRTVDGEWQIDGCVLMDQMLRFSGTEMEILKVVEHVFNERRMTMYRTKWPLYILESALCDGHVPSFPQRCDRTCNLLWHENWLEKTAG